MTVLSCLKLIARKELAVKDQSAAHACADKKADNILVAFSCAVLILTKYTDINVITDVESGATVSSYPSELTTMADQRFFTLPTLTPFVAGSGQTVKNLTTTNGGTVNLYAKWNVNTYTIKYDANG